MGYPIAGRLAKRFNLLVWNRNFEKAQAHSQQYGSHPVKELENIVGMDFIFSCLPSSKESNALFESLHLNSPHSTFIDLSSGDYQSSVSISQKLFPNRYIDAPVSGGIVGASSGTLTVMAGTDKLTPNERLLLSTVSNNIVECRQVGYGNAIKAVNNYLNMTHLLLASEAVIKLKKLGVDPSIALDVINSSSGRSLQTEVRIPKEVFTGNFNYGFKLNLMRKDILNSGFILEDTLFYDRVKGLLDRHSCNDNDEDYTCAVKDLEDKHGEKIRTDKT